MDAGKLDRLIQFWSLGIVSNEFGNAKTETLILETWANVRTDNSMSRSIQNGGIDLTGVAEFIIYQRASFDPSKATQIRLDGKKYVINSITEFKDGKDYLRIVARYED